MRGVEEPLLPEPGAVEGGATQSEGAIETQEARYPRLHKTAGLRGLDVWADISSTSSVAASAHCRSSSKKTTGAREASASTSLAIASKSAPLPVSLSPDSGEGRSGYLSLSSGSSLQSSESHVSSKRSSGALSRSMRGLMASTSDP